MISRSVGSSEPLGAGAAGPLDIGRIGKQQRDPLLAELGEALAIEMQAVDRLRIDLEVAGVDDKPRRSRDREGKRVGRRMGDANRFDGEWSQLKGRARGNHAQVGVGRSPGLNEPAAGESDRDLAAENRRRKVPYQMRECPDVVLVRVSRDDALDFGPAALEVGKIGADDTAAEHAVLTEHHAGVHDNRLAAAFEHHQVEPDLTESAQWDDSDLTPVEADGGRHSTCLMQPCLTLSQRTII